MSMGPVRKCGETRKSGGGYRGFDCHSDELRLYLVGNSVFGRLFQRILSETTSDGSVMGRLEGLQYQSRD